MKISPKFQLELAAPIIAHYQLAIALKYQLVLILPSPSLVLTP
ncbi:MULTISPECIES: hypothetical protein [Cyanophyceae]|nr:hypothetical protein [Coleofasciculus sp. FACHB-125]